MCETRQSYKEHLLHFYKTQRGCKEAEQHPEESSGAEGALQARGPVVRTTLGARPVRLHRTTLKADGAQPADARLFTFSHLGAPSPNENHLSTLTFSMWTATRPLRPRPISTVGKRLNPSSNQCRLFNLSYRLAFPSTDLRGWRNTNKLDEWEWTTGTVKHTMNSHIFNNELLTAGRKKWRSWEKGSKGGEKARENRGGLDRWEQIITRLLSQCVKSVTLQRWARRGRDQWAAFCWSVILNYL